jgi:hypothetical protein
MLREAIVPDDVYSAASMPMADVIRNHDNGTLLLLWLALSAGRCWRD